MVLGRKKRRRWCARGLAVYMIVKEGDGFKTWMSPQFRVSVGEKN
jgi:thiamine biosynthesis lipoprotein ApbE